MKICVIGTGYVGLVAGTCLAEMGNSVVCVDNNLEKLAKLEHGIVPIYEPGLEELIKINVREKRLSFTADLAKAVKDSKVCFIAVATPQDEDGSCNLNAVISVAEEIAKNCKIYNSKFHKGVFAVPNFVKELSNG